MRSMTLSAGAGLLAIWVGLYPFVGAAQDIGLPAKPYALWTPADHGNVAEAFERVCRSRCEAPIGASGPLSEHAEHALLACLASCMSGGLPSDHPNRAPLQAAALEHAEALRRLGDSQAGR